MKKFMNFLKNNSRKIVTIVTVAAVVGLAGTAFASFGPDRPTKAYTQGVAGFDHVPSLEYPTSVTKETF